MDFSWDDDDKWMGIYVSTATRLFIELFLMFSLTARDDWGSARGVFERDGLGVGDWEIGFLSTPPRICNFEA